MATVYCICLDGAPPTLLSRFARDGTMPNLGRIMDRSSWSRAVPSLPTVTSVNWTTMVSGLHCGSHGRPFSDRHLRYFWEAAEEAGMPVGIANIEHNQIGENTFFIGHPRLLSDPLHLNLSDGDSSEAEIEGPEGEKLAEVACSCGDPLEVRIEAETGASLRLDPNRFSDFVSFRSMGEEGTEVCTRFRFDAESRSLYVSPLRTTSGFAQPTEIEERILDIAGYPPVKGFPLYHKGKADLETSVEEEAHHAKWFAEIAVAMMGGYDEGLWFHRHNTTDGIGHMYLGLVDRDSARYDEGNIDQHWRDLRMWYGTVDTLLGTILDGDPDARFAMCTDHGHIGYGRLVSIPRLLVDAGLSKPAEAHPAILDRARSRVTLSNDEIFVNRDLLGPGESEYEELRTRIIEALRGLVDPANGRHVVSLAIRREHAQAMQFWGKERGDVLYELDPGYFTLDGLIADEIFQQLPIPNSSVHHGWLPGFESEVGSNYSFMLFSGHPGGERDIDAEGAPHLVDFAPSVLHMLGLGAPWLQGRALTEMLEPRDDGNTKEREGQ